MIIALDATPLSVPSGGIRRYTEGLTLALRAEFPDDEHHLVSDQSFILTSDGLRCHTYRSKRWWSIGLPRALAKLNGSVFHGTDFAVPYLPLRPSVMTVHDLSPWQKGSRASRRVRRRTPILLRTGIATMVITPSETVRQGAIERFSLKPGRVVAVPLAADERFRLVALPPPVKPYFLFVGTLEPRKNIGRVLEAWREIKKTRTVDLVLAGRASEGFPAPQPEAGLKLLGVVPDEALPALYSNAAALVYPSLYEGFGLPVLEAMQCGALVIASRDPAILEVTGAKAAMHVNAESVKEMIEAMHAALDNPFSLRELALGRARQFRWNTTARRTREVYEEAIRVFSQS